MEGRDLKSRWRIGERQNKQENGDFTWVERKMSQKICTTTPHTDTIEGFNYTGHIGKRLPT